MIVSQTDLRVGSICVAYKEERFIEKHLQHLPDWVEPIVLHSTIPWNGENVDEDRTGILAKKHAETISSYWEAEEQQRNTGVMLHGDKDWILVLDPDEFLTDEDWDKLREFLSTTEAEAVVCEGQHTYWKNGFVADPPRDYKMLIAIRPWVKFLEKRIVNKPFVEAPVWIHHFSWAKTDEEVWNKISHYAHANDFNILEWYENVWKKWEPGVQDVHPVTPDTLHDLKRVVLPPELDRLNLWP